MANRYDIIRNHGLECGEMVKVEDALLLLPRSEALKRQIELREELKNKMVGWLYPQVVSQEIQKLKARYYEPSNKIVES